MDQPVKVILQRLIEDKYGTHGELKDEEGKTLCCTIERPWLNNQHDISCIPAGEYACIPHDSPTHPKCWEVSGVPDRTAILIHTGNTEADSAGCIIIGATASVTGVLMSKVAMDKLREILPRYFTLEVCTESDITPIS